MTSHNYITPGPCPHPDCQAAAGYQCEECGHYAPRAAIRDDGGAYFHRDRMGCQADSVTRAQRAYARAERERADR